MQKVLVIVGPTAVGKTSLSIALAEKFSGEVISGDSLQVYRKLDIGTAKIRQEEMQGIKHHLIDIREMTEEYSVAEFQKEAREKIAEIAKRGHLPIVVGGTGLYIQALLYDYQLGASETFDNSIREKYQNYADRFGKEALWNLLNQKDPLGASKIHVNNERKVIRALEVLEATGSSIAAPKEQPQALYDFFLVGLTTDRELLYQRINQRVGEMLEQGLEGEARLLVGYQEKQAAKGIGYQEFFPYFQEQQTLEETVEQIKQNSRRYAKRQLTWFRNRMKPHWINLVQFPETKSMLEQEITNWLEEKK